MSTKNKNLLKLVLKIESKNRFADESLVLRNYRSDESMSMLVFISIKVIDVFQRAGEFLSKNKTG